MSAMTEGEHARASGFSKRPSGQRSVLAGFGCKQAGGLRNPAVAARVRQLAAQAEHRRAIAEFRVRRAADQQGRLDALLLEAIAALASLLGAPGPHPSPSAPPNIDTSTCRNVNAECCRIMCKHRGR